MAQGVFRFSNPSTSNSIANIVDLFPERKKVPVSTEINGSIKVLCSTQFYVSLSDMDQKETKLLFHHPPEGGANVPHD